MSEAISEPAEPTVAEIRRLLEEAKREMDEFKQTIKPLQESMVTLEGRKSEAYAEYLKAVADIDKDKTKIDRQLRDLRNVMTRAQNNYERLASQLDQMISLEDAENHLLVLEDRWNELTKDAPWRQYEMKHQGTASDKMVFNRRVGLFDVMGLGKTFTVIETCDKIRAATTDGDIWYEPKRDSIGRVIGQYSYNAPPAGRRILYLSPSELVRNVEPEWKKWAPHRQPKVLSKRTKLQREMYLEAIEEIIEAGGDALVLLNPESWRKDKKFLRNLIRICKFDTVIADEAHIYKDRDSLNYRGLSAILEGRDLDTWESLAEPVRFFYPMTGTPFLNRPQELYSLLTLIEPRIFSNSRQGENNFLRTYCEQGENKKWYFRQGGMESLAKVISNRYIRRTLKDAGIKLPPQTITYHELDVDEDRYPAQAKARNEIREKAKYLLSDKYALVIKIELELYLRLRQVETWPAGIKLREPETKAVIAEIDVYESQKMDYVIDSEGEGLLTEVCPDQRTVVVSQFNEPLEVMAKRAQDNGIRAVVLTGDTPQHIRDEIKIDFDRTRCRENDREIKWDCLFVNYKVGGQGLNLTDATQTIALDEEWNPGKGFGQGQTEDDDHGQMGGRTWRIGQTEESAIHIIRMSQTIDTWLASLIEEKKNMTATFRSGMERFSLRDAIENGEV